MWTIGRAKMEEPVFTGYFGAVQTDVEVYPVAGNVDMVWLCPACKPRLFKAVSWDKLVEILNSNDEFQWHDL